MILIIQILKYFKFEEGSKSKLQNAFHLSKKCETKTPQINYQTKPFVSTFTENWGFIILQKYSGSECLLIEGVLEHVRFRNQEDEISFKKILRSSLLSNV